MKKLSLTFLATLLALPFFAQPTYYTSGTGTGLWSDAASWELEGTENSPVGPPTAADHVVIRHSLTHFAESGYTHSGNVVIEKGATYEIISGFAATDRYVFAGESFDIHGSLITTADFQHQLTNSETHGLLTFHSTAMVFFGDDLILEGNAGVLMNNSKCGSANALEDVCFKGAGAYVCGSGNFVVGGKLRAWNVEGKELTSPEQAEAHIEGRVCEGFPFFSSSESCQNEEALVRGEAQFRLLSFEAASIRGQVELNWSTEDELSEEIFVVERSQDETLYEVVGSLAANGSLGEVADYELADRSPLNGTTYYRLKQTLKDGSFRYSASVKVQSATLGQALTIFPNPSTSQRVQVQSQGFATNETITLSVKSLLGQSVIEIEVQADRTGYLSHQLLHTLNAGTYVLLVTGNSQRASSLLEVR
jgi:hypothetical protein